MVTFSEEEIKDIVFFVEKQEITIKQLAFDLDTSEDELRKLITKYNEKIEKQN